MNTNEANTIDVTRPRFASSIRLISFGREEFGEMPRGVILEMAIATAVRYIPSIYTERRLIS